MFNVMVDTVDVSTIAWLNETCLPIAISVFVSYIWIIINGILLC